MMNQLPLSVFILAKNESANIQRCLDSLRALGVTVTVLDSGSTDGTQAIALKYDFVRVESYNFVNHATAYNEICMQRITKGTYALVLDADMILTEELRYEITELVTKGEVQVAQSPVAMWWFGRPLKHGSLYPPKPIMYRGGSECYIQFGASDKLRADMLIVTTRNQLIHDDRKKYEAYLQSQIRYAALFLENARFGIKRWRDVLRYWTPLMLLIVPLYSLFVRFGFLSGKVGILYALDRLIAEAIFFRQALASRLSAVDGEEPKNV